MSKFWCWSGTDAFGRSRGLLTHDDADNDSNSGKQQLQQQSLLSVDTLVFLMIGRLDKLDALCQFIAKLHGDNGNDEKWNTNTPCAIIQQVELDFTWKLKGPICLSRGFGDQRLES